MALIIIFLCIFCLLLEISPDTDVLYQTARKHLAVYVISCSGLNSLFTAKPQDDEIRESFTLARACCEHMLRFFLEGDSRSF